MGNKRRPSFDRFHPPRSKVPQAGVKIGLARQGPRLSEDALEADSKYPIWRLNLVDHDGPWGWSKITKPELMDALQRLVSFETMTWSAIKESGSHYLSHVCKDAMARLAKLDREDSVSDLYSLRITGARRIIGIRVGREFCFLWWDAQHEVCPSR